MTKKFFRKYSWFLVGYNVLVILWGAVVRATGSGAGCGNHWPLCNGEIIPQFKEIETAIELFHRVTSSLDGLLVILLVYMAYRLYTRQSSVFKWALSALVFILLEGMLGRLLVVQNWVADNVSVMRAVVVAIHLVNTYILLATLTVTAWMASQQKTIKIRNLRIVNTLLILGISFTILFSATGAITALGDTLFPAESFLTDLPKDFDVASHFLIRLRIVHPILAILTSGYLYFVVRFIENKHLNNKVKRRGKWLQGVMFAQVMAGGITILTLAPIVMQITHLLLADIFWISLILYTLEVFTEPEQTSDKNILIGT